MRGVLEGSSHEACSTQVYKDLTVQGCGENIDRPSQITVPGVPDGELVCDALRGQLLAVQGSRLQRQKGRCDAGATDDHKQVVRARQTKHWRQPDRQRRGVPHVYCLEISARKSTSKKPTIYAFK